jgi:hypothetical protein
MLLPMQFGLRPKSIPKVEASLLPETNRRQPSPPPWVLVRKKLISQRHLKTAWRTAGLLIVAQ